MERSEFVSAQTKPLELWNLAHSLEQEGRVNER